MDLFEEQFVSCKDSAGRYYTGPSGLTRFVRARPLAVFAMNLGRDYPALVEQDPRYLVLKPRIVPEQIRKERSKRHPSSVDQRRLRDLKWFKRIVGAKVWRVIVKLPVEWRHHFLAIYLSHHDRGFAQLLSSGRHFLAMLLAEHLCSAANDEIPAQELIRSCQNETRKKQREMAEMLQIPRRLLRGMTKVTPAGSNPSLLPAVAKAIEDPNMRKTWDHLPIIGPSTLSLIASES